MSEPPTDRRGSLIALAVIVTIVAGSLIIQRVLHKTGTIEDCMLAGRRNCAPLDIK